MAKDKDNRERGKNASRNNKDTNAADEEKKAQHNSDEMDPDETIRGAMDDARDEDW
ncbi:MAG TPA: hypothetical protein VHF05_02285 [Candidatus Paceibacterota bacterium]|jgi:hypothetical protein|nr:hypothetical protein [Candidatus Paceibacterota bacterium]